MAVEVERDPRGRMSEPSAGDLHGDAVGQHPGCVGVPEVVKPANGQAAGLDDLPCLAARVHDRNRRGKPW
jgi:hypothetical protein